jgi:hypothetical protein
MSIQLRAMRRSGRYIENGKVKLAEFRDVFAALFSPQFE